MKKTISTLLSLIMVISSIFVPAFASGGAGSSMSGSGSAGTAPDGVRLPTATVTPLDVPELTYALKFEADDASEEQLEAYGNWYADFVLTVNKDVTFANEGADGYLAGRYQNWYEGEWVQIPPVAQEVTAGEPVRIMEIFGKSITYEEVVDSVGEFDCGVCFTPEFLSANPDLTVELELRIYNPEDESENYIIGGEGYEFAVVELPTATVTKLDVPELTYALKFEADRARPYQLDEYGNWYADFVLTVNKDVTFAIEGEDGYLAGRDQNWKEGEWVQIPPVAEEVTAGEPVRIMEIFGQSITYEEVYDSVGEFDCGVYFTPEFLAANPDLKVTLELRIYNPEDERHNYIIGGEGYEFTVVELPTATVTKLDVPELTYALKFKADDASEEQLDAYGNWYADFVLTTNKDVTFAIEGEDGYLSGRYQEWNEGAWVNIPPEAEEVDAGESVRIMDIFGQSITYQEVVDSVGEFDCGVYFTPEFLAENNDLEVTLELRIYHPEDESVNYTIGEAYSFVREPLEHTSNQGVIIQGAKIPDNNTVEISNIDNIDTVAGSEVSIDTTEFAGEGEVVDTIKIPASTIAEVGALGDDAELNITLANGEDDDITVSINKEALAAIQESIAAADADITSLTLTVEKAQDLSEEQSDAVSDLKNKVVYKIALVTDDGSEVYTNTDATSNAGKAVTVKIYYEKSSDAGAVVVKHLEDDGTLVTVPFNYSNNTVTITLAHFSEYVVYQRTVALANPDIGGGGGTSSYKVQFETNGAPAVDAQYIVHGKKVTKPADPVKEGFKFEGWYTDAECKLAFDFETAIINSTTLYAKWTEETKVDEQEPDDKDDESAEGSLRFIDVKENAWYYGDVKYAYDNGLLKGVTETTFAPNDRLTRAMLVTVLYRLDGEPATNRSIPFADVDMGAYYANAVSWAKQNDIVSGVTENEFAPNDNITREQIAAIMFRYAIYNGMDAVTLEENLHFDDADKISPYAVSALNWAVGTGLIKGKSESTLYPQDFATRAECAAILRRFIESNK